MRDVQLRAIRRRFEIVYRDLVTEIRRGALLTAEDVEDAYRKLTERVLAEAGVELQGIQPSGHAVAKAARVLRGGARWASLERLVAKSVAHIQSVLFKELSEGALRGRGGREIAERVMRLISPQQHPDGVNLQYLVERIAVSTINNAHHEANIEAAIRSPVVKALKWNTNSYRGDTKYDVCDELASQDLYGLGPGVYPVGRVPPKPHPWCKCFTTSILYDQAVDGIVHSFDKPDPPLRVDPSRVSLNAPPNAPPGLVRRVRADLERAAKADIRESQSTRHRSS